MMKVSLEWLLFESSKLPDHKQRTCNIIKSGRALSLYKSLLQLSVKRLISHQHFPGKLENGHCNTVMYVFLSHYCCSDD